jgi:hypothetical protein
MNATREAQFGLDLARFLERLKDHDDVARRHAHLVEHPDDVADLRAVLEPQVRSLRLLDLREQLLEKDRDRVRERRLRL